MRILRILRILVMLLLSHLLMANCSFAQQYGHWEFIDSTNLPHQDHASVVMEDGNVLLTGGLTGYAMPYSRSAEIYNVATNTWDFTDSMKHPRAHHQMILLNDDRILVIGGFHQKSCEIFNPVTKAWTFTDSLTFRRDWRFTANKLQNGQIIVVGGLKIDTPGLYTLKHCEIFDPLIEKWMVIDSLEIERKGHSAIVMNDGRLLVSGGFNSFGTIVQCEIYDPVTGKWSLTGSLNIPRIGHSSVLLSNGKVLVIGGSSVDSLFIFTCELFDPVTENWEIVGVTNFPHADHASIRLAENLILLAGAGVGPASWELFNTKTFSSIHVSTLPFQKYESTFHSLLDGRIISVGGWTYEAMWYLPTENCLIYYPLNTTRVLVDEEQSFGYMLKQNYPNPFNPGTVISWQSPVGSLQSLKVYDVLGREVAALVNEFKEAGKHSVEFDAAGLPSGVYFYRLNAGSFSETKKMILLQ